jgi:maltose alpha-D-glucosyltransferase/alpha-amylase
MIDRSQADWYRDAVIYQTHVKAFADSNGDGIGDFRGLTERLDYIADLGATAIWLLPFYPSPLRDDGYDIADYRDINPAYGTFEDFKEFVDQAHARGLRIITELVINHTSDQHEWFQRARKAPKGSPERDFYVWSDDDKKWPETRIIFTDTEKSNWTWDEEAGQYYWHRFFSHQPDVNFDNPAVMDEVLDVLRFWLDAGADGLRLDAIPYLVERDGTNNENLPETHDVLKKIRAAVDADYPDRMLLAEANQWPEDTAEYFGDGDECHMAFHFPLMPRMYMAVAQEDRHPITDIMRQTPVIPEGAQWAIFLRNHDELTLEMVTDEERDYLYKTYAEDRRMRINVGIRRRLAPLLGNDRRKIELMMGLLLSMPGTPCLYYGDEIGMGDNIYLGDRDGVRTPMQWSPDRNGGFSRADPARLYSQPIMDPVFGFQGLNVEAQSNNTASLLNWTRRALRIRQTSQVFGRGSLEFLYPRNRRVLAYLRRLGDEVILCTVNLSARAQSVELDLAEFEGLVPVELSGREAFPPLGKLPYLLTMPGYGFYWFRLTAEAEMPSWHEPLPEPLPEHATLVVRPGQQRLDEGQVADTLTKTSLPEFMPNQRWFASKTGTLEEIELVQHGQTDDIWLLEAKTRTSGTNSSYFVPLTARRPPDHQEIIPFQVARLRRGPDVLPLYDALADDSLARFTVKAMAEERKVGQFKFYKTSAFGDLNITDDESVGRLLAEQSNSSVRLSDKAILKGIRLMRTGIHPEVEISRFLTEKAGFEHAPRLLGWAEVEGGGPTYVMVLHEFVRNQGDAWSRFTDDLVRQLEHKSIRPDGEHQIDGDQGASSLFSSAFEKLGRRIGALHRALATPTEDPAFAAEKVEQTDVEAWKTSARALLDRALDLVEEDSPLRTHRKDIDSLIERLPTVRGEKTRIHGDLHLGQVLVSQDDFVVLDFEGEPGRDLEDRRAKTSPLRDVAGMLRSIDYAAASASKRMAELGLLDEGLTNQFIDQWREEATHDFLSGYAEEVGGERIDHDLLRFFSLEKALYETVYEAENRPGWIDIPVGGVLRLLKEEDDHASR